MLVERNENESSQEQIFGDGNRRQNFPKQKHVVYRKIFKFKATSTPCIKTVPQ